MSFIVAASYKTASRESKIFAATRRGGTATSRKACNVALALRVLFYTMGFMNPKQAAAEKAVEFVQDGMVLGLGTGSTVQFALEKIASRMREGLRVRGVPTSKRTESVARELGIPLISMEEVREIDLTIDGADEIDPRFSMIKGGGGALLREKIVASITRTEIVIVGPDKLVSRLGEKFLLPVEVLPFGWKQCSNALEALGCQAHLRKRPDGETLVSDNDNYILDCRFGGIDDPAALEASIDTIPGVIESGLFVGLADKLVIGYEDGRVELRNAPR